MKKERRLYQRLIVDRPATRDFTKSTPEATKAVILDIGPEGIGFTVKEKLKAGTYVFLNVDLGNDVFVELSVQILWAEKMEGLDLFRIGGKIRDAKKEDLEKFVRFYCEQLIPVKKEDTD